MRRHCQQGFSLVEIAVLMVIFGAIITMSVMLGSAWMDKEEFKATQRNIETIENAMERYRRLYDRFPCPANMTLARTNANYGIEAATAGTCTGGTPAATQVGATNVVWGAVPAKTLGIGENLMLDNWGNRFVYMIDREMTRDNALNIISISDTGVGDIVVEDKNNAARPAKAVYAIISHGANGIGAYDREAVLNTATGSTPEAENYNDDVNLAQGIVDETFDDIVSYKQRRNFRKANWDVGGLQCPAATANWGACTATYASPIAHGQLFQVHDATAPNTGAVNLLCTNGVITQSGAVCNP